MNSGCRGFALVFSMMLITVLTALFGAYVAITKMELATTKSSKDSVSGFYSSEAGLNIRAEQIRQTFVGYNRPSGTSPTAEGACEGSNLGSGDFGCQTFSFGRRTAKTYISEEPSNPLILTIPPGERYQNLNAQEYRYTATSKALGVDDKTEALLELRFKSRLVPLFQFAAFYNKDLEILPGPAMTLTGPVHTNGDLYLNSENSLTINGQVTTAGSLYRGRKNDASCRSTPVRIYDPTTARSLYSTCPSRRLIVNSDLTPYNNMIQHRVAQVTVPEPEVFDATPGAVYWDNADLRLVLRLNAGGTPDTSNSATGVEVRNADNSVNGAATAAVHACTGAVSGRPIGTHNSLYNFREATSIRMLDVDVRALFECLYLNSWFGTGKRLDDQTEGGLVFHFSVSGVNSATYNNYGVRVRNAQQLQANTAAAPDVRGVSFISDQAFYTMGHFNSTGKIPAAIMADSLNVLSTNWSDANSNLALSSRTAANTTINAAFLAGTDTTGNNEGVAGQGGAYNGGLENYPRFHENWSGRTLTYRGSFVSLGRPRHVQGLWSAQSYNPPGRDWNYDTSFNNAANLPPITPRFVYLRQELFVRKFEL